MNTKFNQVFNNAVSRNEREIYFNGDIILREILSELSNEQRRELLCDLLCINYHTDNETIFNALSKYI
jgi:hypothetical protein